MNDEQSPFQLPQPPQEPSPPSGEPTIWSPPQIEPEPGDAPPQTEGRNGPAWEWRENLGFWRALIMTLREVLLTPGECFSLARRSGGFSRPLGFNILMVFLVILIFTGFNMLLYVVNPTLAARVHPEIFGNEGVVGTGASGGVLTGMVLGVLFAMALVVPIIITIKAFVVAAILHVCLLVLGGAKHGFEATFRTVTYVGGSATALNLIPFVGQFIGMAVFVVLSIIGLARMHETQMWRCVLAVLIPTVLFIALVAVAIMALSMVVMNPEMLGI